MRFEVQGGEGVRVRIIGMEIELMKMERLLMLQIQLVKVIR